MIPKLRIAWTFVRMLSALWPFRTWRYGIGIEWPTFPIMHEWRRAWECIGDCDKCGELCTGSEPWSSIGVRRANGGALLVVTCSRCLKTSYMTPLKWWQGKRREAL